VSRSPSITPFVDAADVQAALKCSRSTAYYHLRRASGRTSGTGTLLRVPLRTWERYAREVFECHGSGNCPAEPFRRSSTIATASGASKARAAPIERRLKMLHGDSSGKPKIPIPQPRTKRRLEPL
jgi:hypothetical protein